MTDILTHNNEAILVEWLDKIYTYKDMWQEEPVTNRDICNTPVPMRPESWFNPFTLSEQQLDAMRTGFQGGSLKWQQYVEEYLPNLDPKTERQLKKEFEKKRKLLECGKKILKLNSKGEWYETYMNCNDYENCPKCKARREKQHLDRLHKLDGCQFLVNQRASAMAKYEKTYSYKLKDGREITVFQSDERIEGAEEMNYKIAREHQNIQVTGTRVSGSAGKEVKAPKPKVEVDSREVLLTSHILDCDKETKKKIEQAYRERTKDFQPQSLDDAVRLLKQCQSIWFELVKEYCDKIHFVGKYKLLVTENDLDWSDRLREKVE